MVTGAPSLTFTVRLNCTQSNEEDSTVNRFWLSLSRVAQPHIISAEPVNIISAAFKFMGYIMAFNADSGKHERAFCDVPAGEPYNYFEK
jgi:hypothetical protein